MASSNGTLHKSSRPITGHPGSRLPVTAASEGWEVMRGDREKMKGGPDVILPYFLPFFQSEQTAGETELQRLAYRVMIADPTVKSAVLSKIFGVAALEVKVNPADDRPRSKTIAEFVQWNLTQRLVEGFPGLVWSVFSGGLIDGYSVCEKVWGKEEIGRWEGKDVLRDTKAQDVNYDMVPNVDPNRNIVSLMGLRYNAGLIFDPRDFIIWRHLGLYNLPTGMSDFRASYLSFWMLDTVVKLRAKGATKRAFPFIWGTYPDASKQPALEAALSKINYQNWASVPEATKLELLDVAGSSSEYFSNFCEYLEKRIATGIAGAFLQQQTGGVGQERGKSDVHQDTADLGKWWLSSCFTHKVLNHEETGIVPEMVTRNFAGVKEFPQATLGGIDVGMMVQELQIDDGLAKLNFLQTGEDLGERYGRKQAPPGEELKPPAGMGPDGQPLPGGAPGQGDDEDWLSKSLVEHGQQQEDGEGAEKFAEWQESKHKRGQPENAGQFGPGGANPAHALRKSGAAQPHILQSLSAGHPLSIADIAASTKQSPKDVADEMAELIREGKVEHKVIGDVVQYSLRAEAPESAQSQHGEWEKRQGERDSRREAITALEKFQYPQKPEDYSPEAQAFKDTADTLAREQMRYGAEPKDIRESLDSHLQAIEVYRDELASRLDALGADEKQFAKFDKASTAAIDKIKKAAGAYTAVLEAVNADEEAHAELDNAEPPTGEDLPEDQYPPEPEEDDFATEFEPEEYPDEPEDFEEEEYPDEPEEPESPEEHENPPDPDDFLREDEFAKEDADWKKRLADHATEHAAWEKDHAAWQAETKRIDQANEAGAAEHEKKIAQWEQKKKEIDEANDWGQSNQDDAQEEYEAAHDKWEKEVEKLKEKHEAAQEKVHDKWEKDKEKLEAKVKKSKEKADELETKLESTIQDQMEVIDETAVKITDDLNSVIDDEEAEDEEPEEPEEEEPESFAEDAHHHQHAPPGSPNGGQFTASTWHDTTKGLLSAPHDLAAAIKRDPWRYVNKDFILPHEQAAADRDFATIRKAMEHLTPEAAQKIFEAHGKGHFGPKPRDKQGTMAGKGEKAPARKLHVVRGDSFVHKDKIRSAGGVWSSDMKKWVIDDEGAKKLEGVKGLYSHEVANVPDEVRRHFTKEKRKAEDFSEHDVSGEARAPAGTHTGGQWTKGGANPSAASTHDVSDHAADYKKHGTRARAFKEWFGDWENDPENASKVVKEKGEPQECGPIPLYHGTKQIGLDKLVKGRSGGIFFTDKNTAEDFTGGEGGEVLAVYLSIKNPMDLREFDAQDSKSVLSLRDVMIEKGFPAKEAQRIFRLDEDNPETTLVSHYLFNPKVSGFIEKHFDGVIFNDYGTHADPDKEYTSYVAFKPNQVKSVDNIGTFDPKSDVMKHSESFAEPSLLQADEHGLYSVQDGEAPYEERFVE